MVRSKEENMGWVYHHIPSSEITKLKRIQEVRKIFNRKYEIQKDTMRGSVYYGALKDTETGIVSAVVVLTRVSQNDYYNFGYKLIDEEMGPTESKCPVSILKLLSNTDSEYANEWRNRCWKHIEQTTGPNSLSRLPVGSIIEFTDAAGEVFTLIKHPAAYQFKKPFWYCQSSHSYMKTKNIQDDYQVLSKGE
ncbi:MAG: hypothetical protein IJO13_00390 [Lachnospiraceae bacterium]|nr:hypothetical protein [Lachnospiraceae bacterium]